MYPQGLVNIHEVHAGQSGGTLATLWPSRAYQLHRSFRADNTATRKDQVRAVVLVRRSDLCKVYFVYRNKIFLLQTVSFTISQCALLYLSTWITSVFVSLLTLPSSGGLVNSLLVNTETGFS